MPDAFPFTALTSPDTALKVTDPTSSGLPPNRNVIAVSEAIIPDIASSDVATVAADAKITSDRFRLAAGRTSYSSEICILPTQYPGHAISSSFFEIVLGVRSQKYSPLFQ